MRKWHVILTAAAILAGTIGLGAQGGSADEKELQQYRLTPDGLGKMATAAQAFANDPLMKKYRDAVKEADALGNKDELTAAEEKRLEQLQAVIEKPPYDAEVEGKTLSAMADQYARIPPVASALKTAGVTPRDFAKFVVAASSAAMVSAMEKKGMKMPLPGGVSPENVRFAGDHEADIERIVKLLEVPDSSGGLDVGASHSFTPHATSR